MSGRFRRCAKRVSRSPDRLVAKLGERIRDTRVLEAIRDVPRSAFVPPELRARAWEDTSLPIGSGQTISQPYVVARMCELLELRPRDRVLDVGIGSGYHAAVLARLAGEVVGVERHAALAEGAAARLGDRVRVRVAETGVYGAPDLAPFDAINVAAACAAVPEALIDQLAPGGRLVAPVGPPDGQHLVLVRRSADGASLRQERHDAVRFVPLR